MENNKHSGILVMICSFVVLNAVKLTIFNYFMMPSKSAETFLYKFVFAVLVNLIFYSLFFKFKSKWPFFIYYTVQFIYIFANMSYHSYFGGYLHLFQASALFTEGVGPIRHFTIPVNFKMLILLLDLPAFICLLVHYNKTVILNINFKRYMKAVLYFPIIIILCIEGLNYYNGCSLLQLNKNFFSNEAKIIERYGTFVNNISDITVNYGGANLIKHFQYGKTVSVFETASEKPNIVAIQVEAMDADIINQKYEDQYVTPYLNKLAKESIYYPYTLSYHKAGGTSDSEFSILNSIEPLSSYPSIKIPIYDYPNSFIKLLTKQSYYTMVFHGNIGNFYNRDVAFAKMGFNEFFDINKMDIKEEGWGAPDDKVFDYAVNKISEQKLPFFAYIITMSSHMPFNFVSNYYNNSSYDGIEDETVRNYYVSLSYVDKSIEAFVKKIQADFPNTYVLIWGDHTPGINSDVYRQPSYMADNDYFEYVPLIIVTPDKKTYEEKSRVASFLDIAPTILNATGIGFTYKTDGVNLLMPPAELPQVPFKEKLHDRDRLYKEINDYMNAKAGE